MGKCKFQSAWLNKTDSLGHTISKWCQKRNDSEVFCICCDTTISVTNGLRSINQHVASSKHKNNINMKLDSTQLHMGVTSTIGGHEGSREALEIRKHQSSSTSVVKQNDIMQLYSVKDAAIRAELIWAMKNVSCNMSAASCSGIAETFKGMFPGGVPDDFSLSPSKLKYIITDALGPHCRNILLDDVQKSSYSLLFDETTNNGNKKELQLRVRFWSTTENQVVTKHLETFFLGHATGSVLVTHLCQALETANLSMNHLLMIGSDGPNVNKTVLNAMQEKVKNSCPGRNGLLNVGFCNIHIVHNAFLKGLEVFGSGVSEVIIALHWFFSGRPTRWEDYEEIQTKENVPHHKFIKHTPTRWLTIQQAAARLLEQWDAVKVYFLKFIPQKQPSLLCVSNYAVIAKHLKCLTFKAEVQFVLSSSKLFTRFTKFFQRGEPLIHIMYDELKKLVLLLIGRVCKAEVLAQAETLIDKDKSVIFQDDNLKPIREVTICDEVHELLKLLGEKEKVNFLLLAQKHYIASCKHLLNKTPLCNISLLKHFRCLQPSKIKGLSSIGDITVIAKALQLQPPVEIDVLQDEWRLLQLEPPPFIDDTKKNRIDHYWRHYFNLQTVNSDQKYPVVSRLVKSCLALSHGNADVEQGFSKSGRILSEEKANMSTRMLNARITISEYVSTFHNKPEMVPVTRELISMTYTARSNYYLFLQLEKQNKLKETQEKEKEKERQEKEASLMQDLEKKKNSIEVLEGEYERFSNVYSEKLDTSKRLLQEGNKKLKMALQKSDWAEVRVAEAIISSAQEVQNKASDEHKQSKNIEKTLKKRRKALITTFFTKKPKKL